MTVELCSTSLSRGSQSPDSTTVTQTLAYDHRALHHQNCNLREPLMYLSYQDSDVAQCVKIGKETRGAGET